MIQGGGLSSNEEDRWTLMSVHGYIFRTQCMFCTEVFNFIRQEIWVYPEQPDAEILGKDDIL